MGLSAMGKLKVDTRSTCVDKASAIEVVRRTAVALVPDEVAPAVEGAAIVLENERAAQVHWVVRNCRWWRRRPALPVRSLALVERKKIILLSKGYCRH